MHTGEINRALRPSWAPLIAVVGRPVITNFFWNAAIQLDDGGEVHAYEHTTTHRRLFLGADGRAFAFLGGRQYEQVPVLAALETAFDGWELSTPRPRNASAVREMLERHRAGTWTSPVPDEPPAATSGATVATDGRAAATDTTAADVEAVAGEGAGASPDGDAGASATLEATPGAR